MRNLASIQKVIDIQPIPGADKIVCVSVLGWKLIAKVGEFKVGDLCVYIEIDSLLPKDNPVFSFMERYKYRVKSIKMRGQISQGLALPLSMFPDIGKPKEGMDLTDVLKIEKYEKEEEQDPIPSKNVWYKPLMKYPMFRKAILPLISKKEYGGFPSHIISKSDETRIQNMPWMFETYKDGIFVATEKAEGCSGTFCLEKKGKFFKRFDFSVSSRNNRLKKGNSKWWQVAEKYNIEGFLKGLMDAYPAKSWAIQGEVVGEGIQGNIYGIKGLDFYAFRLKKIENDGNIVFFEPEQAREIVKSYGIKWVPILGKIRLGDFYMDSILKFADGKSKIADTDREGIVFVKEDDPSISFKSVSNVYLLKKNER